MKWEFIKTVRPYFTMQLLEGKSLSELIKNNGTNDDFGKWISVFRVCDAVVYAHTCGVLHLDIKPENVMLGKHGRVYLIDWGMARVLREGSEKVRTNLILTFLIM